MRYGIDRLINAAVLLVCVLLTLALMLPAIAQQRNQARASACVANLKQIGLAIHNYHAAFKQLPPGSGGTDGGEAPESGNHGRIGPLVAITPFVNQQSLWESISNPYSDPISNLQFPPMGPVPWYDAKVYKPWSQGPGVYRCPDRGGDQPAGRPKVVYTLESASSSGLMTSYVACYGDGTFNVGTDTDPTSATSITHGRATKRGMFQAGEVTKFRDCLDGLANTAMFSESRSEIEGRPGIEGIAKGIVGLSLNPALCLSAAKDPKSKWWPFGRGSRWCDGALAITGFQTVLPPNSPSCTSDNGFEDAIASASSYHPGGAHLLFGDGRVAFIADTIDAGDPEQPGVSNAVGYALPGSESPYGVWGALGTRAAKEIVNARNDYPAIEPDKATTNGGSSSRGFTNWRDRAGKVSLSAKLVRIIDKKTIELEDAGGVLHQVPLNTLRDQDIYRAVRDQLTAE